MRALIAANKSSQVIVQKSLPTNQIKQFPSTQSITSIKVSEPKIIPIHEPSKKNPNTFMIDETSNEPVEKERSHSKPKHSIHSAKSSSIIPETSFKINSTPSTNFTDDTNDDEEEKLPIFTAGPTSLHIKWTHTPTDLGNPGISLNSEQKSFLQPHFVGYLVGKPGSGKTWLLEEFLLNPQLYGNKAFQHIFIFSPYPLPTMKCQEGVNFFTTFSLKVIQQILDWINSNHSTSNILFIFDDIISSLKASQNDKKLTSLFFNRRKLIEKGTISFLITSQKYKLLPPSIRSNITFLVIFRQSGNDLEHVLNENLVAPKKLRSIQLDMINNHLTSQEHNFAYFNCNTGRTYLNFDSVL